MGPRGHVPGVECGRQRERLHSKDHPHSYLGGSHKEVQHLPQDHQKEWEKKKCVSLILLQISVSRLTGDQACPLSLTVM